MSDENLIEIELDDVHLDLAIKLAALQNVTVDELLNNLIERAFYLETTPGAEF